MMPHLRYLDVDYETGSEVPGRVDSELVMTEYIKIEGKRPLQGQVRVGGAKNAVLPMLLAALLTAEKCTFKNVPRIVDVALTLNLLRHFGGDCRYRGDQIVVSVPELIATEASYSLVKAMRASFWGLAPLLARGRAARFALPGGDIIGARPVDMHLEALTKMGAEINVRRGVVLATAVKGLKPADISLRFPSVGATHQILLAAAGTPGQTVIRGAAREPEVVSLTEMLGQMGASVEGAGSEVIIINGADELGGAEVELIGDRIEASTYLLAALATEGNVEVTGFNPAHLGSFIQVLQEMGSRLVIGEDSISISRESDCIRPVKVNTAPFPEFATDIQAMLMAALTLADGESVIDETIFEGRFGHVSELCRMGADISVRDRKAVIRGVPGLSGAPVEGYDIRGAAAVVVAALAAEGMSSIHSPHHIRRGYENMESKFRKLGASIGVRIEDPEDFIFSGC